jgi:hypothetical protein
MVGFGGHGRDQLVVSSSEDGPVDVGSDPLHHSFAVKVQQPQLPQRSRYLGGDDDLVDGLDDSQPSTAQIEGRVLPVADQALVVADVAPPTDWRRWFSCQHDQSTWAATVGRATSARQRALPGGSGVTGCCRPNDVAHVFGQATRGTWGALREVQDAVQVGDEHFRTVLTREIAFSPRARMRAGPVCSSFILHRPTSVPPISICA